MKALKIVSLLGFLFLFSACSMAPISNLYTARPLGKGNFNLDVGAFGFSSSSGSSSGTPIIKFDGGLTDNLDLGIHYETFDMGLILKYSIFGNKEGFNWALVGSAGSVTNGNYWYAGTVVSYKTGFFEPYAIARYNNVSFNSSSSSSSGSLSFNYTVSSFYYWYFTGGAMMWFTEKFGLGLEYSSAANFTNNVSISANGFWAAALLFRF